MADTNICSLVVPFSEDEIAAVASTFTPQGLHPHSVDHLLPGRGYKKEIEGRTKGKRWKRKRKTAGVDTSFFITAGSSKLMDSGTYAVTTYAASAAFRCI